MTYTPNQSVGARRSNTGFTMVELLVVIAIASVLGILLLTGIPRVRESARRGSCQSNLRQMIMALKMYADESRNNYYPPLMRNTSVDWTPAQGEFYVAPCALPNPPRAGAPIQNTFDWAAVYPEYITEVNLNLCRSDGRTATLLQNGRWHVDSNGDGKGDPTAPIDACAITAESYGYVPWAVPSHWSFETESVLPVMDYIAGLTDLFNRRMTEGPDIFDEDIFGDLTGRPLPRLRDGIERTLITDINHATGEAQSALPVLFDLVSTDVIRFNHAPGGANVAFLDGHVEFIKYPGRFPVSTEFALVAGVFGASS